MERAGLERSMSKKGCSPDNSACEGLFGRIKYEMFYNRDFTRVSIQEFIDILNNYLIWYNPVFDSKKNQTPLEPLYYMGFTAVLLCFQV